MTEPIQSGISNPEAVETATAIGVSNVIVPTEVPIAVDTKQATIKRTATAYRAGINPSIKYATLSALLLPTTPTKVPAVKKIKSIVIIFLSASPCAIRLNFSSNDTLRFCKHATKIAAKKAMIIGML